MSPFFLSYRISCKGDLFQPISTRAHGKHYVRYLFLQKLDIEISMTYLIGASFHLESP